MTRARDTGAAVSLAPALEVPGVTLVSQILELYGMKQVPVTEFRSRKRRAPGQWTRWPCAS